MAFEQSEREAAAQFVANQTKRSEAEEEYNRVVQETERAAQAVFERGVAEEAQATSRAQFEAEEKARRAGVEKRVIGSRKAEEEALRQFSLQEQSRLQQLEARKQEILHRQAALTKFAAAQAAATSKVVDDRHAAELAVDQAVADELKRIRAAKDHKLKTEGSKTSWADALSTEGSAVRRNMFQASHSLMGDTAAAVSTAVDKADWGAAAKYMGTATNSEELIIDEFAEHLGSFVSHYDVGQLSGSFTARALSAPPRSRPQISGYATARVADVTSSTHR